MSLTSLAPSGGCAAKYPAARLEELLRGFVPARGREPARRSRAVRRRRRLPARRRARARLHARLLPAARRRPGALRRGSRRRTRSTTSSRWAGRRCSRSRSRRSRRACRTRRSPPSSRAADEQVRAAGGDPRRRPHAPRRGAEVRARRRRHGASGRLLVEARRAAGDALFLTKPLGTGLLLHARSRGTAARGGARAGAPLDDDAQPRGGGRCCARSRRTPSPTSPASGCSGTRTRLAERSGVRLVLDARRLPLLPGALEAAAAGRAHRRRPAQPRVRRRRTSRPTASRRARRARVRPADRRRAARRAAGRQGRPCSRRRSPRAGPVPRRIGRVERGRGRPAVHSVVAVGLARAAGIARRSRVASRRRSRST